MSVVIVRSSCSCGISPGCALCGGSGNVYRRSDSDDFAVGGLDEVDRLHASVDDLREALRIVKATRDEYVEKYRDMRALAWAAQGERADAIKERDSAINRGANYKAQAERADQADREAAKWLQRASELQAERDALRAMNDRQALALMEADKRVAKACVCRPHLEEKCLGCS